MDLSSIHTQQATSSSSSPSHSFPTQQLQQESSIDSPNSFPDSGALRSSARVKAAKLKEQEKDKGKDRNSAEQASSSSSSLRLDSISTRATLPSSASKFKRFRDTDVKGKAKAKESSDESSGRAIKRYVESI
jgi:E3 ubiquitin-protein ligase TRIP12